MSTKQSFKIIGRSELVTFPEIQERPIPARIDTGAKTSAVWASEIVEDGNSLSFVLFDKTNPYYTGKPYVVNYFEKRMIASSIGAAQLRYVVRIVVELRGKKIRSFFSLADRSHQAYPILIGRNVLRGKFLVDVQSGQPDILAERRRRRELRKLKRRTEI